MVVDRVNLVRDAGSQRQPERRSSGSLSAAVEGDRRGRKEQSATLGRAAAATRLRAWLGRRDRAWRRSTDALRAAEAEIEDLRVDYEVKLAISRANRAQTVRRSARLLAAVAVLVGDDNQTFRRLDVPLHQVHGAGALGHADCPIEVADRRASRN